MAVSRWPAGPLQRNALDSEPMAQNVDLGSPHLVATITDRVLQVRIDRVETPQRHDPGHVPGREAGGDPGRR